MLADPVALPATIYGIKMSPNPIQDPNAQEDTQNAILCCKLTELYILHVNSGLWLADPLALQRLCSTNTMVH